MGTSECYLCCLSFISVDSFTTLQVGNRQLYPNTLAKGQLILRCIGNSGIGCFSNHIDVGVQTISDWCITESIPNGVDVSIQTESHCVCRCDSHVVHHVSNTDSYIL